MKKTFDAVAFMRKRREEIDREDAGLSWKEKREKTRRIVDSNPVWQGLRAGTGVDDCATTCSETSEGDTRHER